MDFNALIQKLEQKLAEPLPGHQELIKQHELPVRDINMPEKGFVKKSAVLLALYPSKNDIYIPMILRPPYDGTHGGQMAFPGGRMEDKDESYERTALREAEEEVGLKALDVKIIGALSSIYIAPSNYWVRPFVGVLEYTPSFFPDPREVAEVFEMSLEEILNPDAFAIKYHQVRGNQIKTAGYHLQGQWIWGASALMIYELLMVLKD